MPQKHHVIHGRDHSHGGADPILIAWEDVGSGGLGLADSIIASPGLDAFWKLNDASGNAVDSSGNGYDLSPIGTITYGAAAGPPGEPSVEMTYANNAGFKLASFSGGSNEGDGSFTAIAWFHPLDPGSSYPFSIMGQGHPSHGSSGWQMSLANTGKLTVRFDASPSDIEIDGNNVLAEDTWYMAAVTYDDTGPLWTLYVNGLAQTETSVVALGGSDALVFLGQDDYSYPTGNFRPNGYMSYAAIWNRALSGSEILDLYNLTP